ncbi:hypothetical protein AC578_8959 [Pseudocercospora eumusae]|uniref:Uncharacterized protein n=1 Tax=Pseudocercospora eumusae TaxID=321146 RepID=A0A139HN59_9PEZI|nr:hypothetical protein AC578_8959 [Pseudocercospora eumusae]
MAPPRIAPLAQSESKARFFQRLNFSEDDAGHRDLYAAMKREAVEGRKRLIEQDASDSGSINETAMHSEILQIYQQASPNTKAVYDLGRDTDGPEEENWIVRWLLWHAFRYRDTRNNRNRRAPTGTVARGVPSGDDSATPTDSESSPREQSEARSERETSGGRYYDPVRSQWQNR